MDPTAPTEDIYEERIARFLELAEAAQEAAAAAARATRPNLQETYAIIAQHWLGLARMAQATVDLNRSMSEQRRALAGDDLKSGRKH